jgi:hypothetical protein
VCQVARSWVDVGSSHTRFVVRFMVFKASVRNILDYASYLVMSEGRGAPHYAIDSFLSLSQKQAEWEN